MDRYRCTAEAPWTPDKGQFAEHEDVETTDKACGCCERKTWDYRVTRKDHEISKVFWANPDVPELEPYYQIHEVYYDETGKPERISKNGITAGGENPADLRADFQMMLQAFSREVVVYEEIANPADTSAAPWTTPGTRPTRPQAAAATCTTRRPGFSDFQPLSGHSTEDIDNG